MLFRFRMPENASDTNNKKEKSAHVREIYNEVKTPEGLSWAASVLNTLMQIHQNKSLELGKARGTFMLRGLCRKHPKAASPRLCYLHEKERIFSPGQKSLIPPLTKMLLSFTVPCSDVWWEAAVIHQAGAACGTQHWVVIVFPALKNLFLLLKKW